MPEGKKLSEREEQILQLVATGMTNREIAQELTISPNTVKVHLSNMFEKIGVASRTEATLYAIEHGVVDVPGNNSPTGVEAPGVGKHLEEGLTGWDSGCCAGDHPVGLSFLWDGSDPSKRLRRHQRGRSRWWRLMNAGQN